MKLCAVVRRAAVQEVFADPGTGGVRARANGVRDSFRELGA